MWYKQMQQFWVKNEIVKIPNTQMDFICKNMTIRMSITYKINPDVLIQVVIV